MNADAMATETKSTAPRSAECTVFELRQYTLHPRARERLIALFEREFVESQEACGASVVGTFRDLDDPDRFVWLRGFAGMPARHRALADFYGGTVWKAHRDAANATMIDSDDVLLLRPAWAGSITDLDPSLRPTHDRDEAGESLVIARIYPFDAPVGPDFVDWFRREAMPLFETLGAQTAATLVTEEAKNDFTALPVREGEHVFTWFARFDSHAAYARFFEAVTHARRWNDELLPELQRRLSGKPPLLRLAPTSRSLLR
jgi:hypothetical protein